MIGKIYAFTLYFISILVANSSAQNLVFISDTQAPIWVEKIYNHSYKNNEYATKLLLQNIAERQPNALFMLGDLVSIGSSQRQWRQLDSNLLPIHNTQIPIYTLMGNHDYMFSKKKGVRNFQKLFPNLDFNQYVVYKDSIAVVMLNANFSKM